MCDTKTALAVLLHQTAIIYPKNRNKNRNKYKNNTKKEEIEIEKRSIK